MTNPVGNEIIYANGVAENGQLSGQLEPFTLQQVANLANTEDSSLVNTNITTSVGGTLTAAGLVGGQITRSGPTAAFSDAVDTAANILAALPGVVVGSTFLVRIKNTTAFPMTLTTAMGVTLPTNIVIPQFSVGHYFVTVNSASAVTFAHMDTVPILDEFIQVLTAEDDITNTTTLAAITGFSVPLVASGEYAVKASLPVNGGVGGLKLAFGTSDTLTATTQNMTSKLMTASAIAVANQTTFGSASGSTAAVVLAELDGVINVATAGTLTILAAQNSATGATTSLLINGFLRVKRVS